MDDAKLAELLTDLVRELDDRSPASLDRSRRAALALEQASPGVLQRLSAHVELQKLGLSVH